MRLFTSSFAALTLGLGFSLGTAHADDIQKGQNLHQDNCISCHADMVGGDGTDLYTRENRIVGDYDHLVRQVNNCNAQLGTNWFDDEIEAVVAYLNAEYYQFDE